MKRKTCNAAVWIGLLCSLCAQYGQAHAQEAGGDFEMNAGTLAHALDRLSTTGRVLYVGAHPDDENTRLLAYLANARHLQVAYLSMTRGGGGQNLIGREQDELLDVIRTQELLAARRLDGALQRFTRMRDFGYSKTAKETLAAWGEQEALADVVFVIRSFQPDVIITRFDEQPPNHGHHTASAILTRQAFAAAADPQRFVEQLALGVRPWQATRLLHNFASWRKEPPPAGALSLDVGGYDARLGLSYGELAARSRSQHKSQGFGVQGERGELLEFFVPLAGAAAQRDIMEGVDLGWNRLGGAGLAQALLEARQQLHRDAPERALPGLLRAQRALEGLADGPRVRDAKLALDRVIAAASGLFVRATAEQPSAVPGSPVSVHLEVVMRRPAGMTLRKLRFPDGQSRELDTALGLNAKQELTQQIHVPKEAPISTPYWLSRAGREARQLVSDAHLVGLPEEPAPLRVELEVELGQRRVHVIAPLLYVWTDRVAGERARRFLIMPPATITPARQAVMFKTGRATSVVLQVRAAADGVEGRVTLGLPAGWRADPDALPVKLRQTGDEVSLRFDVTPPANAGAIEIQPAIEVAATRWSYRQDLIDYPHIPVQVVLQPAALRLVPLALKLPAFSVGYVEGSGDTIAADLAHVGMKVETLDEAALRGADLSRFGAIILGIRAFNTRPWLHSAHARLLEYVERGGNLLVQYNTTSPGSPLDQAIGPYPLEIGRERVTDQNAEMIASDAADPLVLTPNRLTASDFAGWVQERGLYFGAKWDARYRSLYKVGDPDEAPLLGSVLYAKYGKGRFVYTGLAFFRQLPAGVPGAYRLLANLIAR